MACRRDPDAPRPARKDRVGMDPVKAGVILIGLLLVFTWFGFTKDIPVTKDFVLKAVVTDAVSIRKTSPVRIAGVNVGTVKSVEPYGDGSIKKASLVTMQIEDEGLPIYKNATIKIRPRIFLEGNWFVDLKPGSPTEPKLESDDAPLPITQASAPVQFDQILTMLQSNTREDLQALLDGYGTALTYKPLAADDADQDPMVRGKSAAQALNRSLDDAPDALRGTAVVNEALQGENTGDLSRLIDATARVTGALGRDTRALQGLVTNLNRTSSALADERENLRRSIALLGPTVKNGRTAFAALDSALPEVRALALELVPGVEESPETIDASIPWIRQMTGLVGKDELGGVTAQLNPATKSLTSFFDENGRFNKQADLAAQCVTDYVLPLGDIKVEDGAFTTGVENYKEFWYTIVGFNGEAQNYDGNGDYVRFQIGGGEYAWATGPYGPDTSETNAQRQFARSNKPPLGIRPAKPKRRPPFVSDKACKDQALPNVNDPKNEGPADGNGPGGTPAFLYQPDVAAGTTTSGTVKGRKTSGDAAVVGGLIDSLNPFRTAGGEKP